MKILLIVLTAFVLIGGVGFVVINNKDDSGQSGSTNEVSEQQETTEESQTQPSEDSSNPDPNNYTEGAAIGETVDATSQNEVTISVNDNIFETTYLKIKKGTKVTWVNNGNLAHDVSSASNSPNGGLESQLLSNGETYEFTFDEAGLYEYFCTPHSFEMRGVITVVE